MHDLLGLLDRKLLNRDWEARLGAEQVAQLRQLGLLVDAGTSDYFPCDSIRACRRDVAEHPRDDAPCPYQGRCSDDEDPGCRPLDLEADQVQASRLALDPFTATLQGLLGLSGPISRSPALAQTYRLGRGRWAGSDREVLFTLAARILPFPQFLAARQASGVPTLVLALRREELDETVQAAYGPGSAIEVLPLEEAITLEGGKLQLVGWAQQAPVVVPNADAYCLAFDKDHDRGRPVTRKEYERLLGSVPRRHLFLDLTSVGKSGHYRGSRRELGENAKAEEVLLPPVQAAVIAELIATKKPIVVSDTSTQTVRAGKTIEEGRRLIDIKLGAREWRAIQTQRNDTAADKAFCFNPEGLNYLLFKPIKDE